MFKGNAETKLAQLEDKFLKFGDNDRAKDSDDEEEE